MVRELHYNYWWDEEEKDTLILECQDCGHKKKLKGITQEQIDRFEEGREPVQQIFPGLSLDTINMFSLGLCQICFYDYIGRMPPATPAKDRWQIKKLCTPFMEYTKVAEVYPDGIEKIPSSYKALYNMVMHMEFIQEFYEDDSGFKEALDRLRARLLMGYETAMGN